MLAYSIKRQDDKADGIYNPPCYRNGGINHGSIARRGPKIILPGIMLLQHILPNQGDYIAKISQIRPFFAILWEYFRLWI